jgi:hypothetical protein
MNSSNGRQGWFPPTTPNSSVAKIFLAGAQTIQRRNQYLGNLK